MLLRFKFPCDGVCGQRVWSVCVVRSLVRFCKWLSGRRAQIQGRGAEFSQMDFVWCCPGGVRAGAAGPRVRLCWGQWETPDVRAVA